MSLSTLPVEILTRIFALLEGHQISRCGAVCYYFKHVIESSILLQYLMKLDIFGYTDVSGSLGAPEALATRLNQLERRIDSWNHLDWVETRIDAPPRDRSFGIICQGIFATFHHKEVYCIQLPHLMQGILLRQWTLKDFSFPIHQIEIDPSNDLLVVFSKAVVHPGRPDVGTVALHLRTLSDNSPHPRAINHILFSVPEDSEYRMIRVIGHLLGIRLRFRREFRLEIWDWMTGQKLTVLELTDEDTAGSYYSNFEFLSATSIVVVQQGVLEVYQILMETPGTPPVHTASFCMPPSNPDEHRSTMWIFANSRLSPDIDHGNLSDHSSFPSPSLRLAEDSCYLTIQYGTWAGWLRGRFHVPLSSLRCSSMQRGALEIPWEVWSKDVYFRAGPGLNYEISGGRVINYTHSDQLHSCLDVSVFDLNRSRAGRLGMTSADCTPSHAITSNPWGEEIGTEGPHPVHLASRSLSVSGILLPTHVFCDDEHIIFWADDNKLIILTLW